MIKTITVEELKTLYDEDANFKLIDVREPHEVKIATLWGQLIPLKEVSDNVKEFDPKLDKVIVHCRSGQRSADAIHLIESETGQENLYNLEGGILAWADRIDQSLTKY